MQTLTKKQVQERKELAASTKKPVENPFQKTQEERDKLKQLKKGVSKRFSGKVILQF